MRQFLKESAEPLPTQPTCSTDQMRFAEECHMIQGTHLSQGETQTADMTGSTSKAAEITQNICSDWRFNAMGTFCNDHIGPVNHHNQQLQPDGLSLRAEEVFQPVNQEESEKGSQKRARLHNDKIIPEILQNYELASAPSASRGRLLPDHPSNGVSRNTPQQSTFDPLMFDKIYMDLAGCLNEPNTALLSNNPRESTPEVRQNTVPSSAPASIRAKVLYDHCLDSVSSSQLSAPNGRQISAGSNQEEVQGGLFNENTPVHFSSSKSRNTIVQSQHTQSNLDVISLAYQSQIQLTDSTKEPNPLCEDTLKRTPNHMDAVYSRATQIATYYSGHALSWSPGEICKKASIFTETLADKLLDSITCIEIKERLKGMHESHGILIPFTYDLALKDLKVSHWYRIEKTWTCIWKSLSRHNQPISDENILRTFVWVADYISEITSFKEFSHYLDPKVKQNSLPNLQMSLIRYISTSNTLVYKLGNPRLSKACDTVVTYFLKEGPSIEFKALNRWTMRELHTKVLEKLLYISQKIYSVYPTRLKGYSLLNLSSEKPPPKTGSNNLLFTLFQNLQEVVLDHEISGGNVIIHLPVINERLLQGIIHADSSSNLYSGYSSKNLQKKKPLIEVLQEMKLSEVLPKQRNPKEFKFLPSRIRDHLNKYLL
ncbi:hypothetical protein PSTG_03665 [Puccinia striiformis f. sp. tritici PST-78]|uniref:Uncharacterized protein n=1 Tax=Puccinia striiformis f. sp. tritici PST-78 TaxID=1165861 RepID=A0A0L0VUV4_9BASI|nr:hypothetical protein PSTG_03665 [Puccinia striiformis f. sp. tritici PST-78]